MRMEIELQRAHDLLVGVIIGEIDLGYSEREIQELAKVARVLCWALRHDHNPEVAAIIANVELAASRAGYTLEPTNL